MSSQAALVFESTETYHAKDQSTMIGVKTIEKNYKFGHNVSPASYFHILRITELLFSIFPIK